MNHCEKIMQYMKLHGSITARQAERDIGCMRLASRIYDLRDRGVKINTEMIKVRCRGGRYERVARYSLE